MVEEKTVSIIIPTYNSSQTLETCLNSIEYQTYKFIEVIIVDNHSNDKTVEIANRYNSRVIKLRSERAKARNLGIIESKGTYILSMDSDMELSKEVVKECVDLFETCSDAGGIIIPEISVGNSYWVKVRNFERSFYENTKIESARFFKKDEVLSVGGYEEEVVFFEESTLPQKIEQLGLRINLRIDACIRHHEEGFRFFPWLKKKYYYAIKIGTYKKRYASYANDQTSFLYRLKIFFAHPKRIVAHPFLAIGMWILKVLEFAISALGYLSIKQRSKK